MTHLTASEALSIVSKDETKVARPNNWSSKEHYRRWYYGLHAGAKLMLLELYLNPYEFIPMSDSISLRYFLPSVEWEILTKADLQKGIEG